MQYISRAELKSHRAGDGLKKDFVSTGLDLGNRQIKFTISTPDPDRSNDVIKQDGWILDHYLRNPVVLWGHDCKNLPIGKCVSIGVEDGCLKAIVEFVPASIPVAGEIAEAVYQLCKQGFLSATSVGFIPLEFSETDDRGRGAGTYSVGADFTKTELMEFSIVCKPDNRSALIEPGQQTINDPLAVNDPTLVDTDKSVRNQIEKSRRQRQMILLGRR